MGARKALLSAPEGSLLARLLGAYAQLGVHTLAVVGQPADAERAIAARFGVPCVSNPHPHSGMLRSAQLGAAAVAWAQVLVVHPVDVPLAHPGDLRSLLDVFAAPLSLGPPASAAHPRAPHCAAPCVHGALGHPLVLGPQALERLRTLDPATQTLRDVWWPDRAPLAVAMANRDAITNLNTPAALAAWYQRIEPQRRWPLAPVGEESP
jgi:CTP:molybdopterin cytidylyltransferase MocA